MIALDILLQSAEGSSQQFSLLASGASVLLSIVALIISIVRYEEQKRQGNEIERQSREIERQSEAMEREFATEIHVSDYVVNGDMIKVWLSNYGRGIGKNLELQTTILVDGEDDYTTPYCKSLRLVDGDSRRSGTDIIKSDTEMQPYKSEPVLKLNISDSDSSPTSFSIGIQDLRAYCSESIEVEMKVIAETQLNQKTKYDVFSQPKIARLDEIDDYPSLESVINADEY